ncbi:hypothetical protein D9613_001167 [Agrocybe pediades]|uniref:Uncharacterized protein n=1 Tax=Agrocybe pediades TaxID=84607 RepID=A0A8H4R1E2_9AGAR|nr:hypothetical protein D9613_001167 [Agrocybe pediades]
MGIFRTSQVDGEVHGGNTKEIIHGSGGQARSRTPSSFEHISGFPRLVESNRHKRQRMFEVYSRLLLQAGNGVPVVPVPIRDDSSKEMSTIGVNIGDVGFVETNYSFRTVFNIFLPPDHPVNARAPADFSPMKPLNQGEFEVLPAYFPPGFAIASKGIEVTRHSENPLHLSFQQSQESESAVLVLPGGAKRVDAFVPRIREYATKHWENIFKHMVSLRHAEVLANGSIFIVTGFDIATRNFAASCKDHGNTGGLVVDFTAEESPKLGQGTSMLMDARYPAYDPNSGYALFIRGIRLAFGESPSIAKSYAPPNIGLEPFSSIPLSSRLRYPGLLSEDDSSSIASSGRSSLEIPRRRNNTNWIPVNPLTILAELILNHHPEARLTLLDDYLLGAVLCKDRQPGQLTHKCEYTGTGPDFAQVIDLVLKTHDVVINDGILVLVYKAKDDTSKKKSRLSRILKGYRERKNGPQPEPLHVNKMLISLMEQSEVRFWDCN